MGGRAEGKRLQTWEQGPPSAPAEFYFNVPLIELDISSYFLF
jgi:hypothetical protein